MTRERLRDLFIDRGGLIALLTTALYVWIAPQHVVDGDNSEFATLSATGGAAHPTGYPLYVLYLRALSWIPGASPAHSAAIATALLGGATVLVLHAACRAWGARTVGATCAVMLFACGPVVMRVVTEAEVFALNNLVVAMVLWLAAVRGPLHGTSRAFALGLVAGLGLADHVTCVLVAPVGILGVLHAVREARASRCVPLALVGLVLGLSTYGYLLVAPDTPMSWGTVRDVERLVAMFLRTDYGGPTAFQPSAVEVMPLDNLHALASTLGRGWWYVPAVAGFAMLVYRCIVRRDDESRAGWWMLALSFLLCGPLLVLRFNVPPEGIGLYVNQRFHLLPLLLLALPVALACDRVPVPRPHVVSILLATVGVVGLMAPSLPYLGRVHSPAVEAAARNLLSSLPPRAVVIHGQDELHAVPNYLQWAVGIRQDVVIVTWSLMTFDWYRDRVAARGIRSRPGAESSPKARMVAGLLEQGMPVFIDRLQQDIIREFPTYPHGVLVRVLPQGTRAPDPREAFALNEKLYATFALDYAKPGPDDEFATEAHNRYRDTWRIIALALERAGDAELAARARAHEREWGPTRE